MANSWNNKSSSKIIILFMCLLNVHKIRPILGPVFIPSFAYFSIIFTQNGPYCQALLTLKFSCRRLFLHWDWGKGLPKEISKSVSDIFAFSFIPNKLQIVVRCDVILIVTGSYCFQNIYINSYWPKMVTKWYILFLINA